MKLLVIGGTVFLGRQTVAAALHAGHEVTMFNRGKSNPGLFPGAEEIHGDRDGGLGAVEGRRFDAVLDTCGYIPRHVRDSARTLASSVDHYTFISSISVHADTDERIDESTPVQTLEDPTVEQVTGESYGPLKALCEQAVEEEMPGRVLVIRPGLIVGPYDPSGRFTYWPLRVARGGRVLAPPANTPVQIIDARDIADWNLRMISERATGVYNATGPASRLEMKETLEACRAAARSDADFVYATEEFLLENKVGPWMELPLWIPAGQGALMDADCAKAFSAGLNCRPVEDIARDTLAWAADAPNAMPPGAGLAPEKEAELLAKLGE
jgi:2'-hydroxyisoflavone reductase